MMAWLRYYLDFITMPIFVVAFFMEGGNFGWLWLDFFVAGWVFWIFLEYFLHRWALHSFLRNEHWVHHLTPTSMDGFASALVTHAIAVVLLFLSVVFLGIDFGLAFMCGLALGYWTFTVTHHGIHHGWISSAGIMGGVVRRHTLHHAGVEVNFNFLVPLGDFLFNTYRRVPPR